MVLLSTGLLSAVLWPNFPPVYDFYYDHVMLTDYIM